MFLSASTTTTFDALAPITPPAAPSTDFLSDRVLASKMGKSTQASQVSTRTASFLISGSLELVTTHTQYGTRAR
ncbi:Uncharacterised protein [Mycobacteroides abscessus subsp. abscessus]|nr:Uncharacterised protein [Mycobacteroides abscessus subsp. abscessus]